MVVVGLAKPYDHEGVDIAMSERLVSESNTTWKQPTCLADVRRPHPDEIEKAVRKGEQRIDQQLRDFRRKMPSSDPEMDQVRVTI